MPDKTKVLLAQCRVVFSPDAKPPIAAKCWVDKERPAQPAFIKSHVCRLEVEPRFDHGKWMVDFKVLCTPIDQRRFIKKLDLHHSLEVLRNKLKGTPFKS